MFEPTLDNWWALPRGSDELASKLFNTCESIENDQAGLRDNWRRYARYYSNREELGLNWGITSPTDAFESLVTENIVKSVIDTAQSIVASNSVRPRVMTNGGDWSVQRKARLLESWTYGEMKAADVWELGPEVFRDATILGTGVIKVLPKKDCVGLERVLIDEIVVDEAACPRGNPRELFHRRLVDKHVLAAKFPKHYDAIMESATRKHYAEREVPTDLVLVVEGWRLPDADGKKGRHVMAVEHGVITDETWSHDWYPFVFYRWDGRPLSGFYGMSGVRILQGYQQRINQLNNFIERCQNLIAVPRVFVDVASKLLKLQVNNEIGAIIPYRGKPPTFFTPTALNAEIYNYKEQLKMSAYRDFGINEQSAFSIKQPGIEAAAAVREVNDIQTKRFVINAKRYERFFTELADRMITVAKNFVYDSSDKVSFNDRNIMVNVPWSKVDLPRDRYVIDIQPASLLSLSPAARLQAVTELAQVGQLDKAEIRYLLDHPDLRSSSDVAKADFEEALRVEEKLLDGEFEPPEPFHNLELMLRRMPLAALRAKHLGAPDDILELFRTWISQAQKLAGIGEEPADPMGAAPVDPATGQPIDPSMAAGSPPIATGNAGSDLIASLPGQITA